MFDRRTVLRSTVTLVGGTALGPFAGFTARCASSEKRRPPRGPELRAVADLRDGEVRLWLPDGFEYRSFHDTEKRVTLDDDTVLPGRHDGMAAFPGRDGNVTLVRNHEVPDTGAPFGPARPYDPMAQGGTTTIDVTPRGEVVRAFTSLNGTVRNCSGGPMPWGSWLTCEETVRGPDVRLAQPGEPEKLERRHGYLFEVPVNGVSDAEPVTAAGRFLHEAAVFDPEGGMLYMTEDNFAYASGFYRYVPAVDPRRAKRLGNEGRLQMLAVADQSNAHLEAHQEPGTTYRVRWVDIDDPSPDFTRDGRAPVAQGEAARYIGAQGREQGAALFSRLEGAVYDHRTVYFCSTQGGGEAEPDAGPVTGAYGNGHGQVWAYQPGDEVLQLVYQSPGPDLLDLPDNVTTSPRGTLVVCENGQGDNYLRGLDRRGGLVDIALNRLTGRNGQPRYADEFAGSTFSPDGTTLFVNIQAEQGITFAIWGPWEKIGV